MHGGYLHLRETNALEHTDERSLPHVGCDDERRKDGEPHPQERSVTQDGRVVGHQGDATRDAEGSVFRRVAPDAVLCGGRKSEA